MLCVMDLKYLLIDVNYIGKFDNPHILAKEFAGNLHVYMLVVT